MSLGMIRDTVETWTDCPGASSCPLREFAKKPLIAGGASTAATGDGINPAKCGPGAENSGGRGVRVSS